MQEVTQEVLRKYAKCMDRVYGASAATDNQLGSAPQGKADRMRQELLAQGDELRASLEAATSGIMALASSGGHPGTPAQLQVRDLGVCSKQC